MALKLQWTKEAEDQLDSIIEYLEANWSEKEIRKFFNQLESGLQTIQNTPSLQKRSDRKSQSREFQLTSHNTIFYQVDGDTITILLLWPNRMDPRGLK